MIKALFFDIDGTLISFKTHCVPESTISAIKKAKEKGVKVFISTGRPLQLICGLEKLKPYIDGYITANGAYCYVGENTLCKKCIPEEDVRQVIRHAEKLGVACLIVGTKSIAVVNKDEQFLDVFIKMLKIPTLDFLVENVEDVIKEGVLQMTPFFDKKMEEDALNGTKGCNSGRWHPDFVDITAKGIDKGEGLERVASHFEMKISETMAFGDGGNDLPIIKKAGIGVAMGNATDDVKAGADFVTTHIDNDGILNALKEFNVI